MSRGDAMREAAIYTGAVKVELVRVGGLLEGLGRTVRALPTDALPIRLPDLLADLEQAGVRLHALIAEPAVAEPAPEPSPAPPGRKASRKTT